MSNTADGIWALSARFIGIFLASIDGSEVTSDPWLPSPGFDFDSDIAFDLEKKSLLYCVAGSVGSPPDCELHLTSLDQCYDKVLTTVDMEREFVFCFHLTACAFDASKSQRTWLRAFPKHVLF